MGLIDRCSINNITIMPLNAMPSVGAAPIPLSATIAVAVIMTSNTRGTRIY